MAYLDDQETGTGPRSLGVKVAGVLAVVAVLMVVRYVTTGNIFGAGSGGWTTERVDRELQAHPQAGELYRVVKASYPNEYQAFLGRVLTVAKTESSMAVETEAFNFARQLTVGHFDGFSRAPSAQIVDVARQYSLLVSTLQRTDVNLCARFVVGGMGPGTRPPREATAILGRIAVMQIQAARAGETGPGVSRPDLNEQEAAAFFREIERRSPAASRLLADERALTSAPPAQQCAAGLVIYDAIISLPADAAAKATVTLLRHAINPGPAASR
jgi:hypothetical protein